MDKNDPDVAKLFSQWKKDEIAERSIDRIREILSETTRPGCFGGLGHPGMDYTQAIQQIGKILDSYQQEIKQL